MVERSKKHWVGRPITRETTPKPMLDANRYRAIKSKHNPPSASDYQTADGVPFPMKTGIPSCFYVFLLHLNRKVLIQFPLLIFQSPFAFVVSIGLKMELSFKVLGF